MTVTPIGVVEQAPGQTAAQGAGLAGEAWVPTRPLEMIHAHVGVALTRLRAKRGEVDNSWDYYRGDHQQIWLNDALRDAFGGSTNGMGDLQDNYCGMAVKAYVSRIRVAGWRLRKPPPQRPVTQIVAEPAPAEDPQVVGAEQSWDDNDMELEQNAVTRATFVAGESVVLVWPRVDTNGQQATTEDGAPAWDQFVKDCRNVHVEPGAKRRSRLWAAMVWLDRDRWRCTLYYSDQDGAPAEVVRLHTPPTGAVSKAFPQQAKRFLLDETDPGGPMPDVFDGACPMVPFRLDDLDGRSWLHDAIPQQDKINKLAANKMVAAEFLAFPQRWVMTDQEIKDGAFRYSPAKVLKLDPGGGNAEDGQAIAQTKVGEFSTADLAIYDKAKDAEVDTLFTIKLLPRHLRVNPGSPPSGDAIKADEGPHVAYVRDCQQVLGASWADVYQLQGFDVVPVWADPEVANALDEARELAELVRAGVPLLSALRKVGWTDQEIAQVGGELAAVAEVQRRAAEAAALAASQNRAPTQIAPAEGDGMDLEGRVKMAAELVRTGWDPDSVGVALDLPPELVHTGAMPTSVQSTDPEPPAPEPRSDPLDAPTGPMPPQLQDTTPPGATPPQEA